MAIRIACAFVFFSLRATANLRQREQSGCPKGVPCKVYEGSNGSDGRHELVQDTSWCKVRPGQPSTYPDAIKGIWWLHGINEYEVAFCGSLGDWDESNQKLTLSMYESFVFEATKEGVEFGAQDYQKWPASITWKFGKDGSVESGTIAMFSGPLHGIDLASESYFKEDDLPGDFCAKVSDKWNCMARTSSGLVHFATYYPRRIQAVGLAGEQHKAAMAANLKDFLNDSTYVSVPDGVQGRSYDWTENGEEPIGKRFWRPLIPSCDKTSSGTCRFFDCAGDPESVKCVHSVCVCEPGFCLWLGKCVPLIVSSSSTPQALHLVM
mmetsp:Transcript_5312/g.7749  ORF Transcript_5312/g.7749 Transcript_5312/m.7749 type:complete len:322 (-) Transcript_5312:42-1007(-)